MARTDVAVVTTMPLCVLAPPFDLLSVPLNDALTRCALFFFDSLQLRSIHSGPSPTDNWINTIECQGGYVEQVKSYDSAANDVWSLGVILINLVFGRNPWKQAYPRDDTFSAYVLNNNFLETILPMSTELNEIIKAVFCLNPKKRISLPELTRRVLGCQSFTTPDFSPPPPPSTPTAAAAVASPRTVTKTKATMIAAQAAAASLLTKGGAPTTSTAIGSCMGSTPEQQQKGLGQDSGVDFHSMA